MLGRPTGRHRVTLGADKAYDVADFVADLRALNVTPHVAQNTTGRRSAIDGRTTRHPGYAVSQRGRKRIEEAFGWIKTTRPAQDPPPRHGARRLDVHADRRRLQPGPAAQAAGGGLTMPGIPPRPRAGPDGGTERLAMLAEVPFHLSKGGNAAGNGLISAACWVQGG